MRVHVVCVCVCVRARALARLFVYKPKNRLSAKEYGTETWRARAKNIYESDLIKTHTVFRQIIDPQSCLESISYHVSSFQVSSFESCKIVI